MKRKIVSSLVTALFLTGSLAFAAVKANFSGTWVMDKSAHEADVRKEMRLEICPPRGLSLLHKSSFVAT